MTAEDEDDRIFSVSERNWFGLCRQDLLKLLQGGGRNVQFAVSVSRNGWAGSLALKGYMHPGWFKTGAIAYWIANELRKPGFLAGNFHLGDSALLCLYFGQRNSASVGRGASEIEFPWWTVWLRNDLMAILCGCG